MRRLLSVAVLAASLLVAGCGDDGGATSAKNAASRIGVGFYVPEGWALSRDGLTTAANDRDLDAAVPTGPRVRAEATSASEEDVQKRVVAALDAKAAVEVVDEPDQVDVGARPAVAITLKDTSTPTPIVRRYLAATSPTGTPVLFILEAPEPQYGTHAETLAGVPGWVAGND